MYIKIYVCKNNFYNYINILQNMIVKYSKIIYTRFQVSTRLTRRRNKIFRYQPYRYFSNLLYLTQINKMCRKSSVLSVDNTMNVTIIGARTCKVIECFRRAILFDYISADISRISPIFLFFLPFDYLFR